MDKEKNIVVLTHIFVRWLTDFGNIITFAAREGYSTVIYSNPPSDLPYLNWDDPTLFDNYRSLLPPGTETRYLPFHKGKMSLTSLAGMAAIAAKLGRRYPNGLFILWHMVIIIAMGVPLRLMNRKCLFMVTGLGTVLGDQTTKFRRHRMIALPFYRFLFGGKNSRVLTHNHDDKRYLVEHTGVDPAKITVTPGCGVDPAAFPFFEDLPFNDPPVILVPARLVFQKGIVEACLASQILDQRRIRHQIWFTGGLEPFYASISLSQEQLEVLKKQTPSAKFLGYVRSLLPLYRDCDIVCYPTRYPEGVPTVLIEAASCGRPVITTDNVGCRDISIHNETALVTPVNDPTALADALERLIGDLQLRERLRRNAYRKFLAEFTKDIVLERTIEAFESMGSEFSKDRTSPDIRVAIAERVG